MRQFASQPAGILLKRLFLLFWAMYFSMIALTNLVNLLNELGLFDWTFLDSGNYAYIRSVVEVYEVGPALTKLMLAGAIAIELAAAVLFWRALHGLVRSSAGGAAAYRAIALGAFVWISFIFMTEFFVAYESESVFRELLVIMIATALAIALIPDDAGAEPASLE